MTDQPVEWDGGGLGVVRYLVAGAGVGVGALLAVGACLLAWRALRAGAYDRVLAILVALAVLPITGRALVGVAVADTPTDSLRRRPLLVAGGAWALVLAVTVRWRPVAALALLGAAGLLWLLVAACRTSGRLDPAAATLTYGSRTTSLDGLDRRRRIPLGPVTAYWLGYERGTVGSGAPRVIVVPRRVDGRVGAMLARAADEHEGETSHHTPGRTERAVAGALGLGCLLAGPIAWLLLPASGDATLVAGYLTAIGAPFGILLLRYAVVT